MRILGLDDLAPLLADTPPLDNDAALDAAVTWLNSRDPTEIAPRTTDGGPGSP
jgi:hypothetical protein